MWLLCYGERDILPIERIVVASILTAEGEVKISVCLDAEFLRLHYLP